MRFMRFFPIVILLSIGLIGCYTIITHPKIDEDNYSQRVRFYNDCSSCHSNEELLASGYDYIHKYPYASAPVHPIPVWVEPIYTPPWWIGIRLPFDADQIQTQTRPYDRTGLRDMDGGRTSAPTNFTTPSSDTGSSSSSSSSSSTNSNSSNSTNSSNERNSRDSNSTKSRDNSGERKK